MLGGKQMEIKEKIKDSINEYSLNNLLRRGVMNGISGTMSDEEKAKAVKAGVIAAAKMMREHHDLIRGHLYNYLIVDSISVVLGDVPKNEKAMIIKKIMDDEKFCEDFEKSVDEIIKEVVNDDK